MNNSLKDNSQDFGYCLGVLHHIPDTYLGLEKCVLKLKKGAPFYYIYITDLITNRYGLDLYGLFQTF